jgi:hypothetical protein
LNPIELAFSKLKYLLREAAERTVEALWQTIGRQLGRFSAAECTDYVQHCGFAQTERQHSRLLALWHCARSAKWSVARHDGQGR